MSRIAYHPRAFTFLKSEASPFTPFCNLKYLPGRRFVRHAPHSPIDNSPAIFPRFFNLLSSHTSVFTKCHAVTLAKFSFLRNEAI